jgi:hypothetical protein
MLSDGSVNSLSDSIGYRRMDGDEAGSACVDVQLYEARTYSKPFTGMRIVDDYVRFIMPYDRELQFPAMAVLQAYVNGYDQKMKMNDVMPEAHQEFILHYDVTMPEYDWEFFQKAGIKLDKQRERVERPDMETDFSEDRAMKFFNSSLHVAQVYGKLCGIEASAFPQMRTVAQHPGFEVAYIGSAPGHAIRRIGGEELLDVKDGELTCVVGYAGWETYLAASMGLYVAELRHPYIPRNWLSKWVSPFYYMLDATKDYMLRRMLEDMEENHKLRQEQATQLALRERDLVRTEDRKSGLDFQQVTADS